MKLLIFLLSFIYNIINAQSFIASVSNNPVSLDENFEISFTIQHSDINSISSFQPPSLKEFFILGGPSQSSSIQIINGNMSGSRTYSYILKAKSIGKFVLDPASAIIRNNTIKSNSVTIEVVKGAAKQSNPQQSNNQNQVDVKDLQENVFIKTEVNKNVVIKGEQVTVTYKLYTRYNIASPQISKLPSYPGFWSEEIETSNQIAFTRENFNGKVFNVAVLKKVALFPTETGELNISPFEMQIPVIIQKKRSHSNYFDDFFDDPFFNATQTVPINSKSNLIKIKVNPLPASPDNNFNGSVGSFTLKMDPLKNNYKQNEPIDLKINISGTGNIKLIEPPEIELPNGFEKYDPKIDEVILRSGEISGKKNINYIIIPRVFGNYEIPSIKFTYYNLVKRRYELLETQPLRLRVEKNENYTTNKNIYQEEVSFLNQDIRYIKLDSRLSKGTGLLIFNGLFWLFVIIIGIGIIFLFLFLKKKKELNDNLPLLKNMKALKTSLKKIKKAEKYLLQKKYNLYFSELYTALNLFFADKLFIQNSEITLEKVILKFEELNYETGILLEVKEVYEKCELVRFGSDLITFEEMRNLLEKTRLLLIKMNQM